jgi:ACS family hexuronate transporter-like MFS transporter
MVGAVAALLPCAVEATRPGAGRTAWSSATFLGILAAAARALAIVLGKALTDPVWFFITDWFAIYLVSKGFQLESTLLGFWVPFIAADLGNFAGGGLSSYLIRRGWPVLKARKTVVLLGGIGMTLLVPTIAVSNFALIIALFAISTFSYAAWSTMGLTFPMDIYTGNSVATVSGMSGAAAGVGTILSTLVIGKVSDRFSFEPVLIGASILPILATVLVFVLIPGTRQFNVARRSQL